MAVNSGLLTRWIDREGAKRIMVEAGIMAHEIPIAEFSVADRDRPDYVCGLLFEVAYAVASRSASGSTGSRRGGGGVLQPRRAAGQEMG